MYSIRFQLICDDIYGVLFVQGHPRLVKALANTFSPLMSHDIDAMNEVIITVGAYGSLFCAVQGLVNPGDEVRDPTPHESVHHHALSQLFVYTITFTLV